MRKTLSFFVEYKFELAGGLLLLFGLFMNSFPDGYILVGGDVVQPIEMLKNFPFYFYEWQGRVSLYYGIFYILDLFHVSSSAQLSWYLGIFLFGAYLSFLTFCSLIFLERNSFIRTVIAIFYAANLFTLYVFTSSWGYTSYPIVYIFIPILTGLYIRSLKDRRKISIPVFILVSFFCSSSFGNPAFALSLCIYFCTLTIALIIVGIVPHSRQSYIRILVLFFGAVFVNIFWIAPMVPQISAGVQEIASSTDLDLNESLRKTSNKIYDSFRLLPTSEQNRYFPSNFPFQSIHLLKEWMLSFAFIPFGIILIGLIKIKDKERQRLYIVFLLTLIVFIILVTRVREPFIFLNSFIFQLPGLNVLRGLDKTMSFLPFLFGVLIYIVIKNYDKNRYFERTLLLILFFIIITVFPFFIGGLQTKLSYILYNQKERDFTEAKQSTLVKIPTSYYEVSNIFSSDTGDYKISMLPYSPGSSVGRVNLPELKINGPHFARYLYHKPYLELSEQYLPGWKFAEEFDLNRSDHGWIVDLFGLLNVKYILYHKDAKKEKVENFELVREILEKYGLIKIKENSSLIVYMISERILFPYVYSSDVIDSNIIFEQENISQRIQELHSHVSLVDFQKLNPKKIVLNTEQILEKNTLFLNEKYDPLWAAEYKPYQGGATQLQRDFSVRYANAWKIPDELNKGSVIIYYLPHSIFGVSLWITVSALLFVVTWLILEIKKNKLLKNFYVKK